jgi:hypothetical protein
MNSSGDSSCDRTVSSVIKASREVRKGGSGPPPRWASTLCFDQRPRVFRDVTAFAVIIAAFQNEKSEA